MLLRVIEGVPLLQVRATGSNSPHPEQGGARGPGGPPGEEAGAVEALGQAEELLFQLLRSPESRLAHYRTGSPTGRGRDCEAPPPADTARGPGRIHLFHLRSPRAFDGHQGRAKGDL